MFGDPTAIPRPHSHGRTAIQVKRFVVRTHVLDGDGREVPIDTIHWMATHPDTTEIGVAQAECGTGGDPMVMHVATIIRNALKDHSVPSVVVRDPEPWELARL